VPKRLYGVYEKIECGVRPVREPPILLNQNNAPRLLSDLEKHKIAECQKHRRRTMARNRRGNKSRK